MSRMETRRILGEIVTEAHAFCVEAAGLSPNPLLPLVFLGGRPEDKTVSITLANATGETLHDAARAAGLQFSARYLVLATEAWGGRPEMVDEADGCRPRQWRPAGPRAARRPAPGYPPALR